MPSSLVRGCRAARRWCFTAGQACLGHSEDPHSVLRGDRTTAGEVSNLKGPATVRLEAVGEQMRCTEVTEMPVCFAIMAAVQCVASAGESASVRVTTGSAISAPSGGIREGRA